MFGLHILPDHGRVHDLLAAHEGPPALPRPVTVPQPTYYLWAGIGAVEDLDGDDWPACADRFAAVRELAKKQSDPRDWTLWERLGHSVRLVAAVATDPVTAERGIISFLR